MKPLATRHVSGTSQCFPMVEQGLWSTTRNVFPTLSESTDHSINSGKQLSSWCTHLGKCQHVKSGLYYYTLWYFDTLYNIRSRDGEWFISIVTGLCCAHYNISHKICVESWLVVFSSRVLWCSYNLFIHMPQRHFAVLHWAPFINMD